MKIKSFEIERFGIWSGLTISKLFDGVNVFYGANEAGKSTIMEFIRAELYGFDESRRQFARRTCGQNVTSETGVDHNGNSLYAVSGGVLNLESASGSYNIRRMFHPDGIDNFETVELKNSNGEKEGSQLLRVLISGVDEQTFNNIFAIGLDEIQRIGTLNGTDAAEMLFQLSVGMERVSIVDTIKELANRRNAILNPLENENKPALLTRLINDRKKIIDEIESSKLLVREYVRVKDELKIEDRSVSILEDELAAFERERRLYEIAKIAEPIWTKRDKIRREIDAMGNVSVVPDETIQKIDKLTNLLADNRKILQDVKAEYDLAKEEIKSQPVNESLLKFAPRLEVFLEDEQRIIEIDSQITSIENEIKSITSRLAEEDNLIKRGRRASSESAVYSVSSYHEERPVVANSNDASKNAKNLTEYESHINTNTKSADKNNFAGYVSAAKSVSRAKRRLHRVKEHYTEILGRTKVLGGKLKPELASRNVSTINEAIDNTKELANALRKRQAIGQHLSEMSLLHRDLHRANAVLVQNQTMSTWQIAITGLFGVLGVIPAGLAIFEALGIRVFEIGVHPIFILGGLLLSGGVVAYKFISEKSSAGKLKQNQNQLNGLISQINIAKREISEIDSRFVDVVSGSIESRYREAQTELQSLEKLLPIESQYQESSDKLKKFESRLERCKELQSSALRRWQDWLRSAELPVDWLPSRVRDLVEHSDSAYKLRHELDRLRLMLDQLSHEMRTITERIDRVINDAGLVYAEGISYVEILRNIKSALEANNTAIKNRDKLKAGLLQFKKRKRDAIAKLREVRKSISDLLGQYGVKSIEAIRELNKLHQKHRRLLNQEQNVQRELNAAIGNFCSENVIGDILEPRIEQKLRDEFAQTENKNDYGIEVVNDNLEISNVAINGTKNDGVLNNGTEINDVEADGIDGEFGVESEAEGAEKLLTLDQLLAAISGRIDNQTAKLRGELETRGKLMDQLKSMAEDQTFYRKRRELSVIEERIRLLKIDWQVYSVCCSMLDLIRESYERERQPKTLAEASKLFKQLTNGKYVRIWVPLG
ncbi:MAG: AAA family ATPase, partial [Planctomycetaceae bacterium]|nr:AAA family ATPase [Planctomycetaceae bacterium]